MTSFKLELLALEQGERRFPWLHTPSLFCGTSNQEFKQIRARFLRRYLQQLLRISQRLTVDLHPDSAKLQAGPRGYTPSEAQVMSIQLPAYTWTGETEQ